MLSCALRPALAISLECFKGCLDQCSSNGTTEIPAFNPFARGMGIEPLPLRENSTDPRLQLRHDGKKLLLDKFLTFRK
jgi:hypothetical protein